MKGQFLTRLCLGVLMLCATWAAHAQFVLTARTPLPFAAAFEEVKSGLRARGYEIAHVQTCNLAMNEFGYQTEGYHVVFFGKLAEVRRISAQYPEMIPFLPLKIAVFAEHRETVLAALDPTGVVTGQADRGLRIQAARWKNDIQSLFVELRDMR